MPQVSRRLWEIKGLFFFIYKFPVATCHFIHIRSLIIVNANGSILRSAGNSKSWWRTKKKTAQKIGWQKLWKLRMKNLPHQVLKIKGLRSQRLRHSDPCCCHDGPYYLLCPWFGTTCGSQCFRVAKPIDLDRLADMCMSAYIVYVRCHLHTKPAASPSKTGPLIDCGSHAGRSRTFRKAEGGIFWKIVRFLLVRCTLPMAGWVAGT